MRTVPKASSSGAFRSFGARYAVALCLTLPLACGRPPPETADVETADVAVADPPHECPEGTEWDGARCAEPLAQTECPPGPGATSEECAAEAPAGPNGPAPEPVTAGVDAVPANEKVWGDEIGEAYGTGGLGLARGSEGGAIPSGANRTPAGVRPQVRAGAVTVVGRLPREVIVRVVRNNFGRFLRCYEAGLSHNAVLKGRVQVRFVITSDGALSDVEDSGSDLPDAGVIRCVMSSMYGLSFPPPEGGPVKVVFPLSFGPAPPN